MTRLACAGDKSDSLVCILEWSIAVLDSGREVTQSKPDHRRDVIRKEEEEEVTKEDLSQRIVF